MASAPLSPAVLVYPASTSNLPFLSHTSTTISLYRIPARRILTHPKHLPCSRVRTGPFEMDDTVDSIADVPNSQEAASAGQVQVQVVHINNEPRFDPGATPLSEKSLSTASDEGSASSPVVIISPQPSPKIQPKRRRSIGKANKAQQKILIHHYIRLFCKHFGSFGRMKTLSVETQNRAEYRPYTDLRRFHSDFYLKYLELCEKRQTTPYMVETVRTKIGRFAWAEWHWWGKCVNLPMQSQRKELVKWVMEQLVVDEFESKAFTMGLDEFCQVGLEKILKE